MEIPEGRKWMYKRLDRNKHIVGFNSLKVQEGG